MARLREGRANTARGAAHFLRETVARVRHAGATGQLTVRTDSGFYSHTVVAACREMDVRFSITIRQHASLRDLIEAMPEEDWTPIPYWMDGAADVAETTYTPFQTKPDAAPVRLIIRRVKPTPGSQLALFASYSYHAFITDRDGEMRTGGRPPPPRRGRERHKRPQVRCRAEPHAVGALRRQRRLAGRPGNRTQPSPLDGADWSGRGDRDHQTLRRRVFALVGRITRSARHLTLHLPPALALGYPVQSRPGPPASHSTLGLTARLQLSQRPRKLAPPRSAGVPCCLFPGRPRIAAPPDRHWDPV